MTTFDRPEKNHQKVVIFLIKRSQKPISDNSKVSHVSERFTHLGEKERRRKKKRNL